VTTIAATAIANAHATTMKVRRVADKLLTASARRTLDARRSRLIPVDPATALKTL
jgi:ribosomal protein L17